MLGLVPFIPDEYSCLQTNEGNIVQIFVVDTPPQGEFKLIFDYQLWIPSKCRNVQSACPNLRLMAPTSSLNSGTRNINIIAI